MKCWSFFREGKNGRGGLERYGQRVHGWDSTYIKIWRRGQIRTWGNQEWPSRRKEMPEQRQMASSMGLWWDAVAAPWKGVVANEIRKASWPQSRRCWNARWRVINKGWHVWSWNVERIIRSSMKNVAIRRQALEGLVRQLVNFCYLDVCTQASKPDYMWLKLLHGIHRWKRTK